MLGSTRPSTSPSSAQLVSIQPDGLPRGVAVTVMLSTPPHAQRRRRMLLLRPRGHRPAYARTSVRRITGRTSTRPPLRLLLLLVS